VSEAGWFLVGYVLGVVTSVLIPLLILQSAAKDVDEGMRDQIVASYKRDPDDD
jgi:hypothetical protein